MNPHHIHETVRQYNRLRLRVIRLIRDDRYLAGDDAWMAHYIKDTDISLEPNGEGLTCYGAFWLGTTQDIESFCFTLPWEVLES